MAKTLGKESRAVTIPFIVEVIRPFRLHLAALVTILLIYSGNVFLKTHLIKALVDTAVLAPCVETLTKLRSVACYFAGALVIDFLAWRLHEWCVLQYEPTLQNHITKLLFERTLRQDYSFFQHNPAGNLAAKIKDAAECLPAMIATLLYDYLVNSLFVLVAVLTLWKISIWFVGAISLWSMVIIVASSIIVKKAINLTNNAAEADSQSLGHIVAVFNDFLTIRLFSTRPRELTRLGRFQRNYLQVSQRYRWFMLKFYALQGTSFLIYQVVCIFILVHRYSQGMITPGDFAMVLSINFLITDSLWKMSERIQEVNIMWGKASQAMKVLLAPVGIQDKPDATTLHVAQGTIRFHTVTFGYQGGAPLFHQENIYIPAKQKVGLVGYSGSGKTTFVNLIVRLFEVKQGAIMIDEQDIRDVTQDSLYKAITMLPQEATLFHGTLLENIRYGNPSAKDSDVIAAAKQACAHDFIMKLPQGYDTIVGEGGVKPSGGQRQRIALARAILKDSPIIILDEVTAHLDAITEREVQASLRLLMQNKTVLFISHHLDTLVDMDRILVFEQGKIIEDGHHQVLIAQGGRYAALWKAAHEHLL